MFVPARPSNDPDMACLLCERVQRISLLTPSSALCQAVLADWVSRVAVIMLCVVSLARQKASLHSGQILHLLSCVQPPRHLTVATLRAALGWAHVSSGRVLIASMLLL